MSKDRWPQLSHKETHYAYVWLLLVNGLTLEGPYILTTLRRYESSGSYGPPKQEKLVYVSRCGVTIPYESVLVAGEAGAPRLSDLQILAAAGG